MPRQSGIRSYHYKVITSNSNYRPSIVRVRAEPSLSPPIAVVGQALGRNLLNTQGLHSVAWDGLDLQAICLGHSRLDGFIII